MALQEVKGSGQQLTFKGIELSEVVRELKQVETSKKELNEELNDRIKALKKRMYLLAAEMNVKDNPNL